MERGELERHPQGDEVIQGAPQARGGCPEPHVTVDAWPWGRGGKPTQPQGYGQPGPGPCGLKVNDMQLAIISEGL